MKSRRRFNARGSNSLSSNMAQPRSLISILFTQRLVVNGLTGCNSVTVPYVISADLSTQRLEEDQADKKMFQRNVGKLRFIADTSNPGIAWITGVLGRHLHDPALRHMAALKPIYRFLSSRANHGPRYEARGPPLLACYTDSDYAGDRDTRRSVTGLLALASDQPLAASSARQYTVTYSSKEAENVSADTGAWALTWVLSLAAELLILVEARPASLRIEDKTATKYHEGRIVVDSRADLHLPTDSSGAFDIAHTSGPSTRTKHLDVRHHYIQQQVQAPVLRLSQVPASEQWADFLTKAVGHALFKFAMQNIGFDQ